MPDDTISDETLYPLLRTRTLGRVFTFLEETGSTNQDLLLLAKRGAEEGRVIAAERQSAGRGRMERVWHSPPGVNLYFSLLLRPRQKDPSRIATLPLLAGLAIARAMENCAPGIQAGIKWPNDIWIGGRKGCGILCEMQISKASEAAVVIGCGVNVNLTREEMPLEIRDRATSLRIEAGKSFRRVEVLAALLNSFETLYDRWNLEGLAPLLPDLNGRDVLRGRRLTIALTHDPVTGIAEGIGPDGALLLRDDGGRLIPIYSGEAHICSIH